MEPNRKELKEAKLANKAKKQAARSERQVISNVIQTEEIRNNTQNIQIQNEVVTPQENTSSRQLLIPSTNTEIRDIQIKQHFFCLTSYQENLSLKALKVVNKEQQKPPKKEIDFHSRKQLEIETTSSCGLSSKDLYLLMQNNNLAILNEEIFILLLKLSNNKLTKQKEFCRELIKGFTNYIKKIDNKCNILEYISNIKKNFEKLIIVIKKITLVAGGLDNTLGYMSRLLSQLFTIVKKKQILEIKELKELFINKINEYDDVRLCKSSILISKTGITLIKNNDCILTYGLNSYIKSILTESVKEDKIFSLVYVKFNKCPKKTNEDVMFLANLGIEVTFTCIVSISNIITKVSKVFLRAKSMLSNGNLLGKTGSSLIAHVANNFKKPVIVFSETFKFWDKIQIDSFHSPNVYFSKDDEIENVTRLSLHYDVTSANLINMVVCELGLIPPTSIKVILREYVDEEIDLDI